MRGREEPGGLRLVHDSPRVANLRGKDAIRGGSRAGRMRKVGSFGCCWVALPPKLGARAAFILSLHVSN